MERLADGVFDPPVAYADLADYHLDFDTLADVAPEADLRERAERKAGCCAVVGHGAAGLSTTRFAVRVQGASDPTVLTREGFALHIGRETLRALEAIQIGGPRQRRLRSARDKLAASSTRKAGGVSGSVGISLPIEFKAQVASSAREVIQDRDSVSVAQAIEQLISVTDGFGRRMLLVVEDTDVFMPPDPLTDEERQRPRRFIDHVVTYLARDFPSSSLVAVNERYRQLLPAGTIAVVNVPSLRSDSIGRLIEHYARRGGLEIAAEDIADADALAYAAGRYAETHDVRRTLELLHKAVRKIAGEGRGELITAAVLHGL
jgi:hypothetical protein